MEQSSIDLVREYDLPRVIVWDALVDPALVSGWLAEAEIEPVAGGIFNLVWPHRPTYSDTFGRITLLQHPERLQVDTTNLGRITFALESLDGGFRGSSTRVRLLIEPGADQVDDSAAVARITADWSTNLDQLEQLLHGRPTDWKNWERDRRAIELGDASSSTG